MAPSQGDAASKLVTVEQVLLLSPCGGELRFSIQLQGSPAVAACARWVVERTRSDFEKLQDALHSKLSTALPNKARLVAGRASAAELQAFCQALLDEPSSLAAAAVADFFALEKALWQDATVTTGSAVLIQQMARRRRQAPIASTPSSSPRGADAPSPLLTTMGERELLEELATLKAEAAVAAQYEEVRKADRAEIGQLKAEQARLVEAHEVRPGSRHLSALGLL